MPIGSPHPITSVAMKERLAVPLNRVQRISHMLPEVHFPPDLLCASHSMAVPAFHFLWIWTGFKIQDTGKLSEGVEASNG